MDYTNLIKNQKKPHAILLVQNPISNTNKFIVDYIKSFFKDDGIIYKKIENNSYADLKILNAYEKEIKKEEILKIQSDFSVSSIDKYNIQIYIIKGVENLSTICSNTLLKFLEEPKQNVYAIFTTKNPDKVISTIKSRCQTYIMQPDQIQFKTIVEQNKLSKQEIDFAKSLFYDLKELQDDLKTNEFKELFNQINEVNEIIKDGVKTKDYYNTFKNLSYQEIETILNGLIVFNPKKTNEIILLINSLQHNPIKSIIYAKLITILNTLWNQ